MTARSSRPVHPPVPDTAGGHTTGKESTMRHRHGLRKLNRTSRASPGDAAQHVQLAAHARGDQDHACPKAKELRRVVEPLITLGQGADAGQPPPGLRPHARPRRRHQAVRRTRPALQGAPGRLHAHPEDGLSRRRQRADGLRRAGRSPRARAETAADSRVSRPTAADGWPVPARGPCARHAAAVASRGPDQEVTATQPSSTTCRSRSRRASAWA